MYDYLISLNGIIFAWIIGCFFGNILSIAIDRRFFPEQVDLPDNTYERVIHVLFLSIKIALMVGVITLAFACADYFASLTPIPSYIRFIPNDNFLSGFIWSFFISMGGTAIKVFEVVFKLNKSS